MIVWPTTKGREEVRASRRFGAERMGHAHAGVDLGDGGDWVLAAATGDVSGVRYDAPGPGSMAARPGVDVPRPGAIATGGLFVQIRHEDGSETRYMHLDKALVHEGQRVSAGQVIGIVGKSGFREGSTTAAHLHFEILRDGHRVDPLPILAEADERTSPHPSRYALALGAIVVLGLVVILA